MLQFITVPSDNYSIAEEVQMALEGGCKWIQLSLGDANDEEYRETAAEIIPLCKENEAFLVLDSHIALARELSVHGAVLSHADGHPYAVREEMGAEAIIGCRCTYTGEILALKGLDIDYAMLGPMQQGNGLTADDYEKAVKAIRNADIELPIVAFGDIDLCDIRALIAAGVNGIAVGTSIVNSSDPVEMTRSYLKLLSETSAMY